MPSMSLSARKWLGLIAIALGVALIVADTTIVNVLVPSIAKDLDTDSVQIQWVQESYAIVMAALLLFVGRIADIFGARRIFVMGVLIFGATSIMAGVAPTGDLLVLARFLQGAGAAMILPTSLSLLNAMFTGKARGQAFAVWGSTIGAASALGPVVGGWLAEHASWRWAFGINIPLAILILVGILLFVAPSAQIKARIGAPGAILSIVGLGLLAYGLIEGRTYGWVTTKAPLDFFGITWDKGLSPVFVAFVIAAIALIAFVWREIALRRSGNSEKALMDVRLFSVASFRNGNLATLIIGLGEFGIIAVMPLWFQFTLGYTPLQAGLALVPIAVGSFVASGASFGLAAKVSALALVRIGVVLEAVGLAGLGLFATTDSPWWSIALVLFVYGIGVGFATAQITNVVLADIPTKESGQASGIQSTFRQLGSALGIAVLTTVFFSTLGSNLLNRLTDAGLSAAAAEKFSNAVTDSAGAAIAPLAAHPQTLSIAHAAQEAMTQGIVVGGYLAGALLVAALIATFFIPKPRQTEPVAEEVEEVAKPV